MFSQNGFKIFNSILHKSYGLMFTIWVQFKVFWTIICSVPIFMMNVFPSFKWAIKNLRHYKTMFINFPSFIRHWVFRLIKFYITMRRFFSLRISFSSFFRPFHRKKTIKTATSIMRFFDLFYKIIKLKPSRFFAFSASN